MTEQRQLSVADHDRDASNMTWVYPVVSRRSGGVSIGINLNPNNACNWRCIYCQVPGLVRGKAPELDPDQLEAELDALLGDVLHGDFMERRVPEGARRLRDVAFSGNGEPTSSSGFTDAVRVVARVLARHDLLGKLDLVLITNGSLADQPAVAAGLRELASAGGVVWFKLDRATTVGQSLVNDYRPDVSAQIARLRRVAELCPTYVQTCAFAIDGEPPSATEQRAYIDALASLVRDGTPLEGVLLYGLARPSLQPEAARLGRLPEAWLLDFARRIERESGLSVRVAP